MIPSCSAGSAASPAPPCQVLVCFAVREEARFFRPPARPVTVSMITGMGLHKARAAIAEGLTRYCPDLVLSCGFAGGLNPVHPMGRVLFDDASGGVFRHRIAPTGAEPGRFAHADKVLVTAADKRRLFQDGGADAVEMESSAIVAACRRADIPVIVLRVISDTASEDLPLDFNRFTRPDGDLSLPRLLLGIAQSPGAVPRLIRFRRRLEVAARNLAAALECFLSADDLF